MNTDHDGSISTGHVNSAYDMLSRSETIVLMAEDLPLRAIRQQIRNRNKRDGVKYCNISDTLKQCPFYDNNIHRPFYFQW